MRFGVPALRVSRLHPSFLANRPVLCRHLFVSGHPSNAPSIPIPFYPSHLDVPLDTLSPPRNAGRERNAWLQKKAGQHRITLARTSPGLYILQAQRNCCHRRQAPAATASVSLSKDDGQPRHQDPPQQMNEGWRMQISGGHRAVGERADGGIERRNEQMATAGFSTSKMQTNQRRAASRGRMHLAQ